MKLYDPQRHESLCDTAWSAEKAQSTIERLYNTCLNSFEQENLWPVHPDLAETYGIPKSLTGLWNGIAGTFNALYTLKKYYPHFPTRDFTSYLPLLETEQAEQLKHLPSAWSINPHAIGYLLGYSGEILAEWQYTRDTKLLDKLENYIRENISNQNRELMWAGAGTGLIAWFLYQETREERWASLFRQSAQYLFDTWYYDEKHDAYLWMQDMYGKQAKYLGLVHGFSGNVCMLLQGMELLTAEQKEILIRQAIHTFVATAKVNEQHANWLDACVADGETATFYLQLCHGVPSILIALDKLWAYMDDQARAIFTKGAQLVWDAGPLTKPWGLCHGTGGNGYVFLKMYTVTKEEHWLEKARRFAMHAIEQSEKMEAKYGMIRVDHWCGDMGLAIYLHSCLTEQSDFPWTDSFISFA